MRSPPKRLLSAVAAAAAAVGILATAAGAATIVGTATNDVLKGSPRADKLYGRAGNDSLRGYAGNDLLVGGAGADVLSCGGGVDTAIADAKDRVAKDCETVKGLPKPPSPAPPPPSPPPPPAAPPPPAPPPPPPAAPPVRPGFYGGSTSQGEAINLQVTPDSATVSTLNVVIDLNCPDFGRSFRFDLHWRGLRINADRSFQGQDSEVEEGITWAYSVAGRFTPEGPASGTLQVDASGTANGVLVKCSTAAVGWNANPQ
jgi:hypothetical protein